MVVIFSSNAKTSSSSINAQECGEEGILDVSTKSKLKSWDYALYPGAELRPLERGDIWVFVLEDAKRWLTDPCRQQVISV